MASNGALDDRIFADIKNSANAPLDPGAVESVDTEVPNPAKPRTFGEEVARGAEAGLALRDHRRGT